ncbi:MAG: hypothetical protein WCV69_02240 [Patescibacteria group bacterium]|jgi:hypothetical protein
MTREDEFRENLKSQLLKDIKNKLSDDNQDFFSIYLCDLGDEKITYYKKILFELQEAGLLLQYEITQKEDDASQLPLKKPDDFDLLVNPLAAIDYEIHKNVQDPAFVSESRFFVEFKKPDLDIEELNKITSPRLKIIVKDCKILEANTNTLINEYDEDDQAYLIADYLFNKRLGELISFDEIFDALQGTEYNKIEPTDVDKRSIYDSVLAINRYAKKTTGQKIIKNNGQTSYQTIV